MKSLIRKTEINWGHFWFGSIFLMLSAFAQMYKDPSSILFLGLGVSWTILEILYGENPE